MLSAGRLVSVRALALCALLLSLLGAIPAWAGSLHVRESMPAANATITGDHAKYLLRFDGWVDHAASRLEIVQSGRVVQTLTPSGDSEPDVLFASGETPTPGQYVLRWQARSAEGDAVTRGEIPFTVAR